MPLIRFQEKVIFFVHIPKTGGTSVEDAMAQSGAVVALRHGTRFKGFMKTTFQHLNADIYDEIIPSDFYDYAFAVTRHPVSRLVSEYYYRIKRGDKVRPFDDWVNYTLDRYVGNPYMLDNHIRPQVDFVTPQIQTFPIEEGLATALEVAAGHLGVQLAAANFRHNQTLQKTPVTWRSQTRSQVLDFYAADFGAFGYDCNQGFPEVSETDMPYRRKRSFLRRFF